MSFTGNYAGDYEVHARNYDDQTTMWLFCNEHGEFAHSPLQLWKLDTINKAIMKHETDCHV
jgi:hypothetical protein